MFIDAKVNCGCCLNMQMLGCLLAKRVCRWTIIVKSLCFVMCGKWWTDKTITSKRRAAERGTDVGEHVAKYGQSINMTEDEETVAVSKGVGDRHIA